MNNGIFKQYFRQLFKKQPKKLQMDKTSNRVMPNRYWIFPQTKFNVRVKERKKDNF